MVIAPDVLTSPNSSDGVRRWKGRWALALLALFLAGVTFFATRTSPTAPPSVDESVLAVAGEPITEDLIDSLELYDDERAALDTFQAMVPDELPNGTGAYAQFKVFHSATGPLDESFVRRRTSAGAVAGETVLFNVGSTAIAGGVLCFVNLVPTPCSPRYRAFLWDTPAGTAATLDIEIPTRAGDLVDIVVTFAGTTPRPETRTSVIRVAADLTPSAPTDLEPLPVEPSAQVFAGCDVATTVPFREATTETLWPRRYDTAPEQLYFVIERCDDAIRGAAAFAIVNLTQVARVDASSLWNTTGDIGGRTLVLPIPTSILQDPEVNHIVPLMLFADTYLPRYFAGHAIEVDR